MPLTRAARHRAALGGAVGILLVWLPTGCNKPVQPAAQEPSASVGNLPGPVAKPSPPETPPPPRTRASALEPPVRLATWNLSWLAEDPGAGPVGRSLEAYERLAKYAKRLDADVIAVQEVESVAALQRVFDVARYGFHLTEDATPQRTGFVYDRRLTVSHQPDFTALRAGDLRSGADLSLRWRGRDIRLLSVHLKSGCFASPLAGNDACRKLQAQVPVVESWMDARARQGTAFVVLGDFNRRLFGSSRDPVWQAWDDQEPPESDLSAPTAGLRSRCWDGRYPQFVDHLLLSRSLTKDWDPGGFRELLYDEQDRRHRAQLSDHCPISLVLGELHDDAEPPSAKRAPLTAVNETIQDNWIRGNVSRSGKKYYHGPECPNFERVRIDESKGEALFPDESSARAAGFERAPDCPGP